MSQDVLLKISDKKSSNYCIHGKEFSVVVMHLIANKRLEAFLNSLAFFLD